MKKVKAKKHLGQHFLNDEEIAKSIVELLSLHNGYKDVLEIGPGMGVLTQFLLQRTDVETFVVEIDKESVDYLNVEFEALHGKIIEGDFLKMNLRKEVDELLNKEVSQIGIIGNFPYNISSQIFFSVLQHRNFVQEVVCMLQKEVAKRIASKEGNKDYGILSVLLQAFYDIEYCITVYPHSFDPPPRVDSGVIRLKRNSREQLPCDEKLFFSVVKVGFNQRRKKLKSPLKALGIPLEHPLLEMRAEQLSVEDFIVLTTAFEVARG